MRFVPALIGHCRHGYDDRVTTLMLTALAAHGRALRRLALGCGRRQSATLAPLAPQSAYRLTTLPGIHALEARSRQVAFDSDSGEAVHGVTLPLPRGSARHSPRWIRPSARYDPAGALAGLARRSLHSSRGHSGLKACAQLFRRKAGREQQQRNVHDLAELIDQFSAGIRRSAF